MWLLLKCKFSTPLLFHIWVWMGVIQRTGYHMNIIRALHAGTQNNRFFTFTSIIWTDITDIRSLKQHTLVTQGTTKTESITVRWGSGAACMCRNVSLPFVASNHLHNWNYQTYASMNTVQFSTTRLMWWIKGFRANCGDFYHQKPLWLSTILIVISQICACEVRKKMPNM